MLYGAHNIAVERNVSDEELADLGYDRLGELTRLRGYAREFDGDVLVRSVIMDNGHAGYMYGVYYPGDFPFWRGTLESATDTVTELLNRHRQG